MDHAINQLKERMTATIDMSKDIGITNMDMEYEIQAYVDAINVLEVYYYGEKKTSIIQVLS